MKKFCFFILFFMLSFCFVSCGLKNKVQINVSEMDEVLLSGEDENFFVTLCIGKRENPYIVDGISCELIDFAVLTAHKKGNNISSTDVLFSLNLKNDRKTGVFEVNPFDGSFVVDLLSVGDDLENVSVDITQGEKTFNIALSPALEESCAKANDVLEIASKQFDDVKDRVYQNGKMIGELYVRLMQNQGQKPLWYVSLITQEDELFAMIIDPESKQVIAKNF